MAKFKTGDIVQVRGEGPKMTVSGYDDTSAFQYEGSLDGQAVACQWFDSDDRLFEGAFDDAVLTPAQGVM